MTRYDGKINLKREIMFGGREGNSGDLGQRIDQAGIQSLRCRWAMLGYQALGKRRNCGSLIEELRREEN